ncbi:hypothetical protein N7520_004881 [Penicillium odoratum]|uniref:uncharacterized protein n=1 Tax=Penicillium odoratum TaxID=1167516 RepID=UPI002548C332|nr:uncharacterized protein N7520_004881 [Penicillium odoratum]KAJ5765322.1 hypothetical protein N7520_004881 [Penicillium odoratum]
MNSLHEFTKFSNLPTEIRLMIWEHIPQPVRVVGYLPCAECWNSYKLQESLRHETRRHCALDRHPEWKLRYVVQPREQAIFPPLHTCRESRAIWLSRYFRPPRYPTLIGGEGYALRFDVPFISYEKDIITSWRAWTGEDIADRLVDNPLLSLDLFLGLDRAKSQHVGLGEIFERFSPAVTALEMPLFPQLRALSLLVAGPDWAAGHRWLEMPIIFIQQVDCELRNLPELSLLHHPFFGEHLLRNPVSQLGPNIRPLHRYWKVLKALLWHE